MTKLIIFMHKDIHHKSMCESKKYTLCFLSAVITIGVLLLILVLCLTLISSPPTYTIVGFSVPVSSGNDNQNGTFTFYLEIKNPNKALNVYHDDILLTFYYDQYILGEKTLPSFRQKSGGTSRFREKVDANAGTWMELLNSIAISNKTAELKVSLVGGARYKIRGRMRKGQQNLQGRVPIGSDGNISGGKKIKLKRVSKKQSSKVPSKKKKKEKKQN
ncbi:protein NDR1-like [Cornus florida]|uniref:protein NDR1-like n=1 Tax=Cornus florida TaxID=4283 RepID=UPI00289EBF3C|nr:protein NDR1-like [Cornus florida]